jgi:hypothetical protein
MIADAVDRLRGKLWWSNVAVGVLAPDFTMLEARKVYSAIAGTAYTDGSTFARDLRSTGLIEATGQTRPSPRGPEAATFRFRSRELSWGAGRRKRA